MSCRTVQSNPSQLWSKKRQHRRGFSSKATELAESSARLSPIEEVSLALDSEEEVTMQTLKLGSMRLISVDTSEGLPPIREVRCASKFGKVVIQVRQLTRVNATRKVYS
ncbi:hypothetical protein Gotur_017868 [Gossypium turneri]